MPNDNWQMRNGKCSCSCRLLLPSAPAVCSCRLPLPSAPAVCPCHLLLPSAPAACSCRLLLPPAPAACSCRLLLPSAPAACSCPHPHLPAFCSFLILRFTNSRLRGLILSRNTMPSQ